MPAVVKNFDYLVVGGGSGGISSARKAAGVYGARVGLIEGSGRLGGTCVNVGCVPKKVMWNTAHTAERLHDARGYGFNLPETIDFDWTSLKHKRDAYIKRLNGIYEKNLHNDKVEYIAGNAKFLSPKEVEVEFLDGSGKKIYTASHILIAVGGEPIIPKGENLGAEYGVTSDGFFDLETQPKRVALVGAGYIAIEFAGVFNALGSETHLFIRHEKILRTFDPMISDTLTKVYEDRGIHFHKNHTGNFSKIEKLASGALRLHYTDPEASKSTTLEVDTLVWAIGRKPQTERLQLETAGVKTNEKGVIITDEYQNTNVPNIYAIGDVIGKFELTPVAIAAGRKLADRLFGPKSMKDSHLAYESIPSVVFAQPEIGTIGFTEPEARKKYGDDKIKIYKSSFVDLYYSVLDVKPTTQYKLIVTGPNERVVGLHLIGNHSAEILQGFGVAVKMGATKADFDSCVAIHPTSAEEIVTLK